MLYMNYELSRCPYCGSEINKDNADWLRYDKSRGFAVSCECGACGPKKETKEKAIMAWSRRECFDMESIWKPFDIQENDSGFKGSLKSIEFASVLQILLSESKSGILQVFQGRKRSAICSMLSFLYQTVSVQADARNCCLRQSPDRFSDK